MAYQRYIRPRRVPKNCEFCASNTLPTFRQLDGITKYISERGKMLAHTLTGVCSRHQRQVAREIKRARFLALLPYTGR